MPESLENTHWLNPRRLMKNRWLMGAVAAGAAAATLAAVTLSGALGEKGQDEDKPRTAKPPVATASSSPGPESFLLECNKPVDFEMLPLRPLRINLAGTEGSVTITFGFFPTDYLLLDAGSDGRLETIMPLILETNRGIADFRGGHIAYLILHRPEVRSTATLSLFAPCDVVEDHPPDRFLPSAQPS